VEAEEGRVLLRPSPRERLLVATLGASCQSLTNTRGPYFSRARRVGLPRNLPAPPALPYAPPPSYSQATSHAHTRPRSFQRRLVLATARSAEPNWLAAAERPAAGCAHTVPLPWQVCFAFMSSNTEGATQSYCCTPYTRPRGRQAWQAKSSCALRRARPCARCHHDADVWAPPVGMQLLERNLPTQWQPHDRLVSLGPRRARSAVLSLRR
jgi:hypothetical protein